MMMLMMMMMMMIINSVTIIIVLTFIFSLLPLSSFLSPLSLSTTYNDKIREGTDVCSLLSQPLYTIKFTFILKIDHI